MMNNKYTFERFVVGENNSFAYNVCMEVAKNPCGNYNPLYLQAPVGLGKTHLMKAIVAYLQENRPELRVLYLDACEFTNEFIDSLKQSKKNINAMAEFKEKYRRNIDVLLIDDIEFLVGKECTQEEFFNVFNDLYMHSKQIVLSSDISPKELTTLDEKLTSRFGMGIVANIKEPDFETRLRILKSKQQYQGYKFDENVLSFIANNVKHSIRSLEGALNKLFTYCWVYPELMNEEEMDLSKLLKEFIDVNKSGYVDGLTLERIMETVSERFAYSLKEIKGKSRAAKLTEARQIGMYLSYHLIDGITLDTIGKYLGGRDHVTIMHGIRKIDGLMSKSEELLERVMSLRGELSA